MLVYVYSIPTVYCTGQWTKLEKRSSHGGCFACSSHGRSPDGQFDDDDGEDVDKAGDGGGQGDEHGVQLGPGVEHTRLVVRQGSDELRAGVCA